MTARRKHDWRMRGLMSALDTEAAKSPTNIIFGYVYERTFTCFAFGIWLVRQCLPGITGQANYRTVIASTAASYIHNSYRTNQIKFALQLPSGSRRCRS